jgi:hypothetical protein
VVSNEYAIDPMPISAASTEGASKLRQMRLRTLTLHDPKILLLSLVELRTLGDQARQFAFDCGPMDFAYPRFAALAKVYDSVAFLKECETRRYSRERELALARFVPMLGSDFLDLTSAEALERAEQTEEESKQKRLRSDYVRRLAERTNAYVELASVLEGWERQLCRAA